MKRKDVTFNDYKIYDDGKCEFYYTNRKGIMFTVKVDRDILDKLIELNQPWNVFKVHGLYYCQCMIYFEGGKGKSRKIYLHRYVMNVLDNSKHIKVDHVEHDGLDNRRSNLRITDNTSNTKNRKSKNINNTTGYRNVSYIKDAKYPYRVQLQINGKNTILGEFIDVDKAGAFAKEMRKKYYKEYKGNN